MGFELPDGKTARNIQEQVAFLTEKLKDLYAAFNELGIKKIEIVDELPETGQEGIIYLVPAEDPETGNYYEEYIWLDNAWELLGTTKIDLSNYCTLNTDQTITAVKTITNDLFIANTESQYSYEIKLQNNVSTARIRSNGYVAEVNANWCPRSNNSYNLGNSSNTWKDLYLTGSIIFPAWKITDLGDGDLVFTYNNSNKFYVRNGYALMQTARPISNNAYDLGTSGVNWKDLYLSGTAYIKNINPGSGQSMTIGNDSGVINANCVIRPTYSYSDLGTSSNKWRDLFLSRNLSDGTNTATIADIAALITYAKAQGWIS